MDPVALVAGSWRGLTSRRPGAEPGGRGLGLEGPGEADERLGRCGAGRPVRGDRGGVVGLRADPHAVAAALAGELGERLHERAADAAAAVVLVHRELVEEHLAAL